MRPQLNGATLGRPSVSILKPHDFAACVNNLAAGEPLAAWRWLVVTDVVPVLVTLLGDVFARDEHGQFWFLDTYRGVLELAASSEHEWTAALASSAKLETWFAPDLIAQLREAGLRPDVDECYSPLLPPVVGGSMDPQNFECSPWRLHIGLTGQLHEKGRSFPDGTPIAAFVDDSE